MSVGGSTFACFFTVSLDQVVVGVAELAFLALVRFGHVFLHVEIREERQHDDHVREKQHLAPHRKVAIAGISAHDARQSVKKYANKLSLHNFEMRQHCKKK